MARITGYVVSCAAWQQIEGVAHLVALALEVCPEDRWELVEWV